MWDADMREAGEDGEAYFQFLCEMKKKLREYEQPIKELKDKYFHSSIRILDQYNWMVTHKASDADP
jgi:hypothetical protein